MKTMYHCTKKKNLRKILKKGLLPKMPKYIRYAIKGVYLSEKKFDWMHMVTEDATIAGAMIEVNVDGLKLIKDKNTIIAKDENSHPAYVCLDAILPERFVSVSVSKKESPCSFCEYKTRKNIKISPYLSFY